MTQNAETAGQSLHQERLLVVAINGHIPGQCGLVELVVQKQSEPGYFYLLDPRKGLQNCIDRERLQQLADEKRVRLLAEPREVAPTACALFARHDFLQAYESGCKAPFPWGGESPIALSPEGDSLLIADEQTLRALRRGAAERLLKVVQERIAYELKSDWHQEFFPNMEKWCRCGALCVGSSRGDPLYLSFHQHLATLLFLKGDNDRQLLAFKQLVQPHFPALSYDEFAATARTWAKNWQEQSDLFFRETSRRKTESIIQSLSALTDRSVVDVYPQGARSGQAAENNRIHHQNASASIVLAGRGPAEADPPSLNSIN
ncbi:hypothetical protein [Candidatus Magnetaquicoccus inordinatus]|uniref:hypothetical protein n=1 Tax=Candidatus Magnetaquicoccus inordinatus TaxID=2496818 RepID=UPI001D0E71CE|nr:hypothetical protein [Candidatus Magnetaquicoccus inordinatus]